MFDFISESFNRNNSYEYKLSIQVSLNGFSFCIRNEADNQLLVFKQTDFVTSGEHLLARRFHDWVNDEELLLLPYDKKEVVVNHRNFSLLPEQLESENLKKSISELLPGGTDTEFAEGWIKAIKAKLIYHLPPELAKTINEVLGESRLMHPVQKLIGIQKRSPLSDLLLLYFDQQEMYLVLKKEDELALCNYFQINHANDALYYILTTVQQLGLFPKATNVSAGGKAAYREDLTTLLQKYFKHVEALIPQLPEGDTISIEVLSEHICLF